MMPALQFAIAAANERTGRHRSVFGLTLRKRRPHAKGCPPVHLIGQQPQNSGYASAAYASSLMHLGTPLWLPNAEGWLICRQIPGSNLWDAIGCYPLLACRYWNQLEFDLSRLADLVSVTAVVDPLVADQASAALRAAFPDLLVPYKQHFLVDLQSDWAASIPRNHRRNTESSLSQLAVQRCSDPGAELEAWCDLYGFLKQKHGIAGQADFSRESFARQLRAPGVAMFKASKGAEVVAMHLWFVQGKTAYYHLGASSGEGYRLRASFALMWSALAEFQRIGLHWAALGGAPDAPATRQETGLTRFKEGWATGARPAYLCGLISDRPAYDSLTAKGSSSSFFPAYRSAPVESRKDASAPSPEDWS